MFEKSFELFGNSYTSDVPSRYAADRGNHEPIFQVTGVPFLQLKHGGVERAVSPYANRRVISMTHYL